MLAGESMTVVRNVVAMRASPDSESEQVSQAIVSDTVTLMDPADRYCKVRSADGYEGWMLRSSLAAAPGGLPEPRFVVVHALLTMRSEPYESTLPITRLPFGCRVTHRGAEGHWSCIEAPLSIDPDGCAAPVSGYVRSAGLAPISQLPSFTGGRAAEMALRFAGVPYLWGGTTPFGFDCSGLVQRVYAHFGAVLPRDAFEQAACALVLPIPERQAAQPGDLMFFRRRKNPGSRSITHVGMAIDAESMVHASGDMGVARSAIDSPEIVETYLQCGSYRLVAPPHSDRRSDP